MDRFIRKSIEFENIFAVIEEMTETRFAREHAAPDAPEAATEEDVDLGALEGVLIEEVRSLVEAGDLDSACEALEAGRVDAPAEVELLVSKMDAFDYDWLLERLNDVLNNPKS